MSATGHQDVYTGQSAIENRDIVDTKFPINEGIITDWDAMEYIWNQMYFEDLLVPPEDYNILHTESIINNSSNREKLVEVSRLIYFINTFLFMYEIKKKITVDNKNN